MQGTSCRVFCEYFTSLHVCNKPTRSTQPCIPLGSLNRVPALTDWGKGGNVTSAGWQVILCDPIWHVSSRSGEACGELLYRLLYLLTLLHSQSAVDSSRVETSSVLTGVAVSSDRGLSLPEMTAMAAASDSIAPRLDDNSSAIFMNRSAAAVGTKLRDLTTYSHKLTHSRLTLTQQP